MRNTSAAFRNRIIHSEISLIRYSTNKLIDDTKIHALVPPILRTATITIGELLASKEIAKSVSA